MDIIRTTLGVACTIHTDTIIVTEAAIQIILIVILGFAGAVWDIFLCMAHVGTTYGMVMTCRMPKMLEKQKIHT